MVATFAPSQPKVLLIEPEALSRQYIAQALGQLGLSFDARTAYGDWPSKKISDGLQMVILGLESDVSENLQRIQLAREHCAGAVIMGVCPRILSSQRIPLLNAGVGFIIEKPFFPEECVSAVQAIFRRLPGLSSSASPIFRSDGGPLGQSN